jgi:hypothetical protein
MGIYDNYANASNVLGQGNRVFNPTGEAIKVGDELYYADSQTGRYQTQANSLSYTAAELRGMQSAAMQQAAVSGAAGNAARATAPGQSVFDTKLASMASGTFNSSDPSYQWRFEQGQQAVERSAASKGMLGSGNILQELTSYGQGMASTEYAAQFDRMLRGSANVTQQYGSIYNSLAQMMGAQTSQGQLGVAQGGLALQGNQQRFNQDLATNKSQGAADALAQLYAGPSQAPVQSYYGGGGGGGGDLYSSYSYVPAQSTNNYQESYGMSPGQGYITSSSGNTSTFGGYSGDTSGGFGGGE